MAEATTMERLNSIAVVFGYLAISGIIGTGFFVIYVLVEEACRSYRQCRRVERILCGKGKRAPLRSFLRRWRQEYLEHYTSLNIGGFVLPYDSRKPIKREWWG